MAQRQRHPDRIHAEEEWELFVRDTPAAPIRHIGSVTAPTAETAHDRAGRLVPEASAIWCCPAEHVARFGERTAPGLTGGGS
jgi:rSAM-partnered protein